MERQLYEVWQYTDNPSLFVVSLFYQLCIYLAAIVFFCICFFSTVGFFLGRAEDKRIKKIYEDAGRLDLYGKSIFNREVSEFLQKINKERRIDSELSIDSNRGT